MSGEYEFEPVRGLPEELPAGETMLWQGAPDWKSIAIRTLHIRGTAIYFALLLAWYLESKLTSGEGSYAATLSTLRLALFAFIALLLMAIFAWFSAKTTVYTVTTRRVVMRVGVALPMVLNLPFAKIDSVDFKGYADGSGDIALALPPDDRLAYLMLWPHVRPWRLARAQPLLRGLPDAVAAAEILGKALAAAESGSSQPVPHRDWETTDKPVQRPRAAALA